jgi:membrane protein required for colicin V production
MEDFTIVDGVVAGIIILSAILAYSRGFVREAMAIVGWVGAALLAFIFAPAAQPLIKEVPVLGDFLADSCELSMIGAFAAVFAVGLILASLFTPLLSSVVQRSALSGVDQGLGFLFGVARGVILVLVAFLVYDRALSGTKIAIIDDSRSAKVFATFQDRVDASVPDGAPDWIVSRYNDLTQSCAPQADAAALEAAPAADAPAADPTAAPEN